MVRTVDKYGHGMFASTMGEELWIRPTFGIESGAPSWQPARDFEKFVRTQEHLIAAEFAGKRMRRKAPGLLTLRYGNALAEALSRRISEPARSAASANTLQSRVNIPVLALNLMIIEQLGVKARGTGTELIVLDVSQYFGDNAIVSRTLKEFCDANGFGYIPVYDDLMRSDRDGVPTRRSLDRHFNESGNLILARSLYAWISRALQASAAR
jgi:hypothetical protein